MLVLIVDPALILTFVSKDATAAFAPAQNALGTPITDCAALVAADPTLVAACQAALAGAAQMPITLDDGTGPRFLRRIGLRDVLGQPPEVIVTYEPDPDLTRATLNQMRTRLATAMEASTEAYGIYDASERLVLCNATYANLYPGP